MGSDLSLDLRYFASKVVKQVRDAPMSDINACIHYLEEEQGKIKKFRKELPLCTRLLAEVIDVMKAEVGKKAKSEHKVATATEEDGATGDKSKWMSTTQLWAGDSSREVKESEKQEKGRTSPQATSHGGDAFLPFKVVGSGMPTLALLCLRSDDKAVDAGMPDLSLLSPPAIKSAPAAGASATKVVGFTPEVARVVTRASSNPPSSPRSQPQQTAQQHKTRKARRTWSPELHHQFVVALNKLGGPQFATPKHIREVMKVDGLTNDEVKSHLQKYRLHNRRSPGSAVVSQPTVRMGGMWIPREQSSSQFGSPQGPLHFSNPGIATVSSSADTINYEKEDGRFQSYGWK